MCEHCEHGGERSHQHISWVLLIMEQTTEGCCMDDKVERTSSVANSKQKILKN